MKYSRRLPSGPRRVLSRTEKIIVGPEVGFNERTNEIIFTIFKPLAMNKFTQPLRAIKFLTLKNRATTYNNKPRD